MSSSSSRDDDNVGINGDGDDDDDDDNNNGDDDFIATSTTSTIVDVVDVETTNINAIKQEQKKEIDIDIVNAIFRGKKINKNEDNNYQDGDNDIIPNMVLIDRINQFLDQSFFDPDKYNDNDNSFFGKFARLIKNDYELFETLYVGCFFIILIIITQDVLRAQIHAIHTQI